MEAASAHIRIIEENDKQTKGVSFSQANAVVGNIDFSIKTAKINCGTEVTVSFVPSENCSPEYIDICFNFSEAFSNGRILAFNNATCTNDPVSVVDLSEANDEIISRDIVLFKSETGFFNVAMTSANRFYTHFVSNKSGTAIRFALEGKPLNVGEYYVLEQFVFDDTLSGGDFFDLYAQYMAKKYNIKLPEKIDSGWSSWSCFYKTVTQEKVLKQSELVAKKFLKYGADLIQIDDGWQNGATFCADWTAHSERFPDGIENLSEALKQLGLRTGLWYAPAIYQNDSEFYQKHNDFNIVYENGEIKPVMGGKADCDTNTNGAVYPLDLENDDVVKHICDSFARAVNEYGCKYFKIDFIIRSLLRCMENQIVTYKNGYNVEVYRNVMKKIRETVGEDSYMLACGAPITEAIGIFDSIRTSPDITWEAEAPNHPGYFKIVTMDAQNVFLRSYYHGRVFINDPDALVVRGKIGDVDDNFTATISEAKVWATVVAMSGGTVLINEEIDKLDSERIDIIKNILPQVGISLVPEDFFEFPLCTRVSAYHNKKRIAAVFNWDDISEDKFIKNSDSVFAFDCWNKNFVGKFNGNIDFINMEPHSVNTLMLVKTPNTVQTETKAPVFLCEDSDFYMGIKAVTEILHGEDNFLAIKGLSRTNEECNIYMYLPDGILVDSAEKIYKDKNGTVVKVPKAEKIVYREI